MVNVAVPVVGTMTYETGVVHLAAPQFRLWLFDCTPPAMGVQGKSARSEFRELICVLCPLRLVSRFVPRVVVQSPACVVPSTIEITFPEAVKLSLPLLPLPSAYVTVALIPGRVEPTAAFVVKATDTLAVPNPGTLPNE